MRSGLFEHGGHEEVKRKVVVATNGGGRFLDVRGLRKAVLVRHGGRTVHHNDSVSQSDGQSTR